MIVQYDIAIEQLRKARATAWQGCARQCVSTWTYHDCPFCNNNNVGVFLLRHLHHNEGEWVINTIWPEVALAVYSERYWWWVGSKFYRRHADPSARHLFWLTVGHLLHHLDHCVKPYNPRLIAGTNLPTPTGWIAWQASAHVYVHKLLRVITRLSPMSQWELNPGRRAQDPTRCQWTNRAVHYRPTIKSQKTARSAVRIEPTSL